MALHALQEIGDAVDVSREFLFPVDLRRWLKLAVVAFFVGGGTGIPTAQFEAGGTPTGAPGRVPDGLPTALPGDPLAVVAVVAAALLLLGLVFAVVGAVMEFVFVESLLDGTVSVRRYWRRRWGQGLRLFAFRVAIGLPLLLSVLGWMAVVVVPLLLGGDPLLPFGVFLLGLPVVFLLGLVYGVVNTFTTVFVVPLMIRDGSGVLAGWRRLWPSLKAEWKQYLGFAVVWLGLTIGTGLLASIAVGVAAVVALLPLGLVAGVVYLALGLSTPGIAVLAVLAVLFVLSMFVAAALVRVPVLTYLRYYALLVLGDVEPEFDLVADRRPAVDE